MARLTGSSWRAGGVDTVTNIGRLRESFFEAGEALHAEGGRYLPAALFRFFTEDDLARGEIGQVAQSAPSHGACAYTENFHTFN